MRKNDLIKLLQNIEGNPEVLLWNGMVGDWMHIDKPVEGYLVKIDKEQFIESCRLRECRDRNNWEYQFSKDELADVEKWYKRQEWEENHFVTEEDIKEKRWKQKRVLYLQAKKRGVSTFDRLGNIEY
jgi:hypothetical protein